MKTELRQYLELLTEEEEQKLGDEICRVLKLKRRRRDGYYETSHGNKTKLGIVRTIFSIMLDN
jgi:ABC-type multidrug transport system ATPase subunit